MRESQREEVPAALEGERLDRVTALLSGASRARAAATISAGGVRVNDAVVAAVAHRVHLGDVIEIALAERQGAEPDPDASVEFAVVFADADVAVIDKPAGLVVHPGSGVPGATLVNGLLARFPAMRNVGSPERPGIVHRLDKGTTGLLVVALNQRAYESLVAQISARTVERRYLALVWGHPEANAGVVDAPIGRSARDPSRMAVVTNGRPARTAYEVVQRFTQPVNVALLQCRLETGRTHQIRVHLSAIGHPIVGDDTYHGARPALHADRPMLHAAQLAFTHPKTGERLSFEAPLPGDFEGLLSVMQ